MKGERNRKSSPSSVDDTSKTDTESVVQRRSNQPRGKERKPMRIANSNVPISPRLGQPVPAIYLSRDDPSFSECGNPCETADEVSYNSSCVDNVPESISNIRDNLRNMIDTMGSDETPSSCDPSCQVQDCPCTRPVASKLCMERPCNVVVPAVHRKKTEVGTCEDRQPSRSRVLMKPVGCCSSSCVCRVSTADTALLVNPSTCPCSCEPGPDSPCVGKRSTMTKISDFLTRVVTPSGTKDQEFTFKMNSPDSPPRRLVFDLVQGIPQPKEKSVEQIPKVKSVQHICDCTKTSQCGKANCPMKGRPPPTDKVELYYFDHGNSGYYRTTDNPPPLITDDFHERTDHYATQFWAEIFGVLHIGCTFITAFILQFFRFLVSSILRPLIVGVVQLLSDYFFKPLLSILFNGVIQPVLILIYNISTSFRDLCEPLAHTCGYFLREAAVLFAAIRLVEVNTGSRCNCGSKPCRCPSSSV